MREQPPFDLERLYGAKNLEELCAEYDRIAAVYDGPGWDWLAPALVVRQAAQLVPREGLVLDAGAGTGQLGVILRDAGYLRLDAMDLSTGMLAEAAAKGVYSSLREGRLGHPLDYPDGTYHATVACGVFTTGHAPASGLRELVRITRQGGHVIFTLRSDATPPGFEEEIEALSARGAWELAERSDEIAAMPVTAPHVRLRSWAFVVR
ncbi:MAG: class I SAM-dependent methyltransferase [Thermoleophilia bacterium]|nr:class I SAM-dependent methyltransferase [Thermoleophilia bacterium]